MQTSLSDVKIAPHDVDTYVEMRRLHINPALAEQPGFMGSTLLRAREQPAQDEVTFALFNFWRDDASAKAWAVAPRHDEVSEYVIPLVRSINARHYELVDEASTTHGEERAARIARIGVQQIKADRIAEYLAYRRDVIHASMAEADGFVAAWVLRDLTDPARFALYFRWESDDAADAYFHKPFHLGEITDRVKEFLESTLSAGARYDIVPVHSR